MRVSKCCCECCVFFLSENKVIFQTRPLNVQEIFCDKVMDGKGLVHKCTDSLEGNGAVIIHLLAQYNGSVWVRGERDVKEVSKTIPQQVCSVGRSANEGDWGIGVA